VFQQLASLGRTPPLHVMLQSPFTLHRQMLAQIARVAASARSGRVARIVVKVNALTDVPLIEALIAAANAGASIDLIVRGACMLRPIEVEGGGGIRIRSVVGRFLEHSRIAYFRWGEGVDEEALFLSSADWMGRNMFGRVEVAWPVREAKLRQRVIDECLVPYLHDGLDAWTLAADGSYSRAVDGESAQQALVRRYAKPVSSP
jgi:polyphosphate kinase